LANPQHLKAVPGRKTDVKDAEWLADLHRHGLLKASFIPPQPVRALRELTRYRKTLVQERAQQVNRLQKVLEGANIKLASVATDVLGKSGREMVEALVGGEQDAQALSELARGRLRGKLPALRLALEGRVQPHHRFLLGRILAHIDFLEESLEEVQREIEERLAPFEEAVTLAQSVIGIQATAAAAIVAEIGIEMHRFPSDKHLARLRGYQPGQPPEWWQAPLRGDHLGQPLSASSAGRSGLGDCSHQRQLSLRFLPPRRPPSWQAESHYSPGS